MSARPRAEAGGIEIPGSLVAIPAARLDKPLDGFLSHGRRRRKDLLIYVHGMHSNFYGSALKKAFLSAAAGSGYDALSFNNRGAESATNTERFRDCLRDLDAVMAFARERGYERFALCGHSTGCQKIAYYQSVRRDPSVLALVLLALGDDYAIARRDAGAGFARMVRQARRMTAAGRGDEPLPGQAMGFSAARFLSIADPREIEARLFDFGSGRLDAFRRVRCAVLAVFADADEYSLLSSDEMARILCARTRSACFEAVGVPGADHGFHGQEDCVAGCVLDWLGDIRRRRGGRGEA